VSSPVTNILGLIAGSPQLSNNPTNHVSTITLDGNNPTFVVQLPTMRLVPPQNLGAFVNLKPAMNSPMVGPLRPAMANFWPLWEGSGSTVTDLIANNTGVVDPLLSWVDAPVPNLGSPWSTQAQPVLSRAAHAESDAPDITLTVPILLQGSWSIDYCWRLPYIGSAPDSASWWRHTTITNDPLGGCVGYSNGQLDTAWATNPATMYPSGAYSVYPLTNDQPLVSGVYAPNFTINSLLQAVGYINGGSIQLEYFRVWNRVLNLTEIQSLAMDPFCMFGVTPETLAEIATVVQFMSPTKQNWNFLFP
jgi:hypothetical protein